MPKDKLTDYSATNASNTDVGGVNIDEGMLPSAVNNALRELLTHLKEFSDGTSGIDVLSLADDDASASIKLQAPASVTSDTTLTLPDGDGDSGQTLITNGSGTLSWAAPYGNRNLLINSAMTVSQRGTSQTGITGNGYFQAPDRWRFEVNSAGTWSVSQSTTAPDGFSNSYKIDCTTADASLGSTDYIILMQRLEGQDLQHLKKGTASAESLTISFWVRSAKTGTYILELDDNDNARNINKSYTISSANTWEHKTITFAGDTTGAFDNDNNASLRVLFWLAAGSIYTTGTLATSWEATNNVDRAVGQVNLADSTSNDFYITGVQLEVGEQATPFDHSESYGETLARCQRYFQKSYDDNTAPGTVITAGAMITRVPDTNPYLVQLIRRNIVTMRTTPSVVSYSPSTGAADKVRVSAADFTVAGVFDAGQNSTGFPQVSGNPSAGDDVRWHFTLDAEL